MHSSEPETQPLRQFFADTVAVLSSAASAKSPDDAQTLSVERFAQVFDFRSHAGLARLPPVPLSGQRHRGGGGSSGMLSQVNVSETCRRVMQSSHADLISTYLEALDAMYSACGVVGRGARHGRLPRPAEPLVADYVAAHDRLKQLCGYFVQHFGSLMNLPISKAVADCFATYRTAADAVESELRKLRANGTASPPVSGSGSSDGAAAIRRPASGVGTEPKTLKLVPEGRVTMDCTMLLQKAIGLSLISRGDPLGNKRKCVVPLAAQLLRTYLRDGQFFLCDKLLRDISSTIDVQTDIQTFPARDGVTFSYHLGKFAVIRGRFRDASYHLGFAAKLTQAAQRFATNHGNLHMATVARANLRRIWRLLVPVKMVLGQVPSPAFLTHHGLESAYGEVRDAVKRGRVGTLRNLLERHKLRFAAWGTLFALERLEPIAFRNLVRLVHVAADASTRLPISSIETAMRLVECEPRDCASGQAASHLALLVELGLVRGYLSHEHQMLVLSEKNAFPPVRLQLLKFK